MARRTHRAGHRESLAATARGHPFGAGRECVMLSLPAAVRIFRYIRPVDMHESCSGLKYRVEEFSQQSALAGHLFAFCTCRGNRLERFPLQFSRPASRIDGFDECHDVHAGTGKNNLLLQRQSVGLRADQKIQPGRSSWMCRSRNWRASTSEGAPSIRSEARCVLGKAITSRMLSLPAKSITQRSRPSAIPPWGGAP